MKALIVGGSSGMGKETAKLLLQRSVEVVLIANNIDKLQKTKKELEEFGTVSIESILYKILDLFHQICIPLESTRFVPSLVSLLSLIFL